MSKGTRPSIRRKNLRLDQRKLTAARRALGARTETETIERALDLVLFRREVLAGLERFAGRGGIRDVYAPAGS
ncbi:MAG: hypothetical protein ACREMR_09855 [Gemmatimonadales bacterium]